MHKDMSANPYKSDWAEKFATVSVGCLAFSVSLGVALVSISCLLIVLASLIIFIKKQRNIDEFKSYQASHATVLAIKVGLSWVLISVAWSISSWPQIGTELIRSSRLLVIPLVTYLIFTSKLSLRMINVWILGQVFVLFSSYALWLKVPVPWAVSRDAIPYFTPFTTTLDQPIMNSVMIAVLWFFKDHFKSTYGRGIVYSVLLLTFVNISFLMIGRSGMLSMILVITLISWLSSVQKFKKYVILVPFLIFVTLWFTSPKFQSRIQAIPYEISEFQKGNIETSQAIRLDFWYRSIQAVYQKPILGFGVGSWPKAYKLALNGDVGIQADSPHQQFLLWWVEEGSIGFILLLCIYISIFWDALKLKIEARNALICTGCVLFFTSLMNAPLQGAGISEFFCVIIGLLLVFQNSKTQDKELS
jgi:O-antigen ligase